MNIKYIPLFLITLFACCSGNRTIHPAPVTPETITLETSRTFPLKGTFNAFNTANLFTFFNTDEASFRNKINSLNPDMLRFPGGTVANFYHPKGKGYGFRRTEIKTREGGIDTNLSRLLTEQDALKDTANFLEKFIPFAKQLNSDVIYVANIISGEISETLQAIQRLQSAGLTVKYVELGNEFYLNAYRDLIPDANTYLTKAKPFAAAIRQQFPGIKLSVPAEAKLRNVSNKTSDWDLILSKSDFYDAVSIHVYPDFKNCISGKNNGNFNCFSNEIIQLLFHTYPQYLRQTSGLFKNKPLLITEWNIAKPNRIFGNTMLHGIYTALFQLENMRLNSLNPAVQLMCFHNLASKENAYSLLTPENLNKNFPPSVNFAVFKMLAPVLSKPLLVPVSAALPENHSINLYAFQAADGYHLYILNSGNVDFRFKGFMDEKGNAPELISVECLYGTSRDGQNSSLESYRYKQNAEPLNCPPYSFTHITLKF